MKFCTKCKTSKPVDRFALSRGRSDGRNGWCKPCQSAAAKGPKRRLRLLTEYGLSPEAFETLMREQNGWCAACRRPPTGLNPKDVNLHVDHDHWSGFVRGLLCNTCNRALGLLGDNSRYVRGLLRYIEAWEARAPE